MSVEERLDALYAELPTIDCKKLCAPSCGPIDMSVAERDRLIDLGVTIPRYSVAAGERWAANMKVDTCRALKPHPLMQNQGICGVYRARPMICRLWGLTESMPCEWGCVPSRVLTDAESYVFLARAMEIGGHYPDQPASKEHRSVLAALEHPTLGPLMRRFIRGESELAPQIEAGMREAGLVSNP